MLKNKLSVFYLLGVLTACILNVSCSDSLGPRNSPPVIMNIIAAPAVVSVNNPVTFTAEATDIDNDDLTYTWEVNTGEVSVSTSSDSTLNKTSKLISGSNKMIWRPSESGVQQIFLTVSDGRNTVDEIIFYFVEPEK